MRKLIDLMGADIYLDDSYDSGVAGFRGARFVIPLNRPPEDVISCDSAVDTRPEHIDATDTAVTRSGGNPESVRSQSEEENFQFPDKLRVLFVDDDMLLRRLFVRSVSKFNPNWEIRQAASGEASLRIIEEDGKPFDICFVDQYMASVDQQLLGTETVRAMRSRGVRSRICGLSANDMEAAFKEAGADMFWMKPFPCKKEELAIVLRQVLGEDFEARDGGH